MAPNRVKTPTATETNVLVKSRRRCCICYGLERDDEFKKAGQIAHLDRDPSKADEDNLAFMCLEHHDAYDSRTSQSKGFTIEEVKRYRAELHEYMHANFDITVTFSTPAAVLLREPIKQFIRVDEPSHTAAEITLTPISADGDIRVTGHAAWGLWRDEMDAPHTGEISFIGRAVQGKIEHVTEDTLGTYRIDITIEGDTLNVKEVPHTGHHGHNVNFGGTYKLATRE